MELYLYEFLPIISHGVVVKLFKMQCLYFVSQVAAMFSCGLYDPKNRQGLFPYKARSNWIFWVKGRAVPAQDYEKPVGFQEFEASRVIDNWRINTLNAELNPICCLLALLGAHHFLHVSRIRVKSLSLRLIMSYIYIYIYIYI